MYVLNVKEKKDYCDQTGKKYYANNNEYKKNVTSNMRGKNVVVAVTRIGATK